MGWKEKSHAFTFENTPIDGLFFLDGKLVSKGREGTGIEDYKFPRIYFPSGEYFDLWEHADPTNATVHLFGEMDLPLFQSREEALTYAHNTARMLGYAVTTNGEHGIDLTSDEGERYTVLYDATTGRMSDVIPRPKEAAPQHPAHDLMPQAIREKLPKLYVNEKLGLEALAQVKYFTPDANWTWYGSEFDGKDILFGLVAGYEVELGYFTLSELQKVRGALGLPIERDLHFAPATLRSLMQKHEEEQRGGKTS